MSSTESTHELSNRSKQFKINAVEEELEWFQVRSCLARAFYNYPLYKYLVPNSKAREEFLVKFLEANYDVAVRHGKGVVLSISKRENEEDPAGLYDVIGGCFFVPPHENGGWDCAEDQTYFDSYVNYGMGEVDNEALQNMISYEKWESENIFERIKTRTFNSWLAYFWGIDPKYSGCGYGSETYSNVTRELAKIHGKMFPYENHKVSSCSQTTVTPSTTTLRCKKGEDKLRGSKPIIAALCHCERAERFHGRHGFQTLTTFTVDCRLFDQVDECSDSLKPRAKFILLDLKGVGPMH